MAWWVYVEARFLNWLDIKNLWLGRAAGPEYVREAFDIKYGNESCRYDKTRYVNGGFVEKAKGPE